jgi:hypothetical protein
MAQQLRDIMGKLTKGPNGLGTGLKLLVASCALGYGATQSVYTGT